MRPQPHRTFVSLIVGLVIGLTMSPGASAASGDGRPEFYRGLYVELGSFAPLDVDTRIGLVIPEIVLDLELDLDRVLVSNDKTDRSRFRGGIRFNRRHELKRLPLRLLQAAVDTPPLPCRLLSVAEAYW